MSPTDTSSSGCRRALTTPAMVSATRPSTEPITSPMRMPAFSSAQVRAAATQVQASTSARKPLTRSLASTMPITPSPPKVTNDSRSHLRYMAWRRCVVR